MLREHGLVADKHGDVMVVSLPGAFAPGCYFSTNVTLTFNQMRLYKTDLSQPIPDCL
jgi:peroxiredoxin